MYFDEPSSAEHLKEPAPLAAVLVAATVIIIVLGLYPGPVLNYLLQVAKSLVPAT